MLAPLLCYFCNKSLNNFSSASLLRVISSLRVFFSIQELGMNNFAESFFSDQGLIQMIKLALSFFIATLMVKCFLLDSILLQLRM